MSAKYIIRLDDASEFITESKWDIYFQLFDKFNIKPIIAVIPYNKDPKLINNNPNPNFWKVVLNWQRKGYIIALHGLQHIYVNKNKGIMGINNYSEFAGVIYETQHEMIKSGIKKFNAEGINTNMFIAPAHSFDKNTLKALIEEKIEYISDGFLCNIIKKNNIIWIPQQMWFPKQKKNGVWTICLHPESSEIETYKIIEKFIVKNHINFSDPYKLPVKNKFTIQEHFENYVLYFNYFLKKTILSLFNYLNIHILFKKLHFLV